MEKELNIAAILKDKPVGLIFYSPTFGCVTFNGVHKDKVYFFSKDTNAHSVKQNGKMYDGGECIIFPSKEMRDWSKFAWKKGDVLVSKDNVHIIFEKFEDDTYTRFKGKHYLWKECNVEDYNKEETKMLTSVFEKATDDVAQTYIKTIEEHLDGKLNIETLEIEKQPEFKDGDIIKMTWDKYSAIVIFWEYSNFGKGFDSHVFFNIKTKIIEYNIHGHTLQDVILRLATDEEKQQLFDALAKKGKAWDAEKKMLVDLPKKCEFKPFDKVLVRDDAIYSWRIELFGRIDKNQEFPYFCITGCWKYCIPYNDSTKHLLGTTDEWKGGEG